MLTFLPEAIDRYVERNCSAEAPVFVDLAETTRAETPLPQMMVGNMQGTLLRMLVRATGAARVLEIGTFTGYSTLAMAMGLPEGGKIITCDVSAEYTEIARRFWARSTHGRKIRLVLGPALETITAIEGRFDMVFIDADKANYSNYWDACIPRVRTGGLVVVDNVLWSGKVLDPQDDETRAIVAFNQHVCGDARVEHAMLPVRDGMMLATKL